MAWYKTFSPGVRWEVKGTISTYARFMLTRFLCQVGKVGQ